MSTAGLMLRADERRWLKTGLEVTSGAVQLSTVFTRENSDLSVVPVPGHRGGLVLRLTRFGSAVCVHRGDGDGSWQPSARMCGWGPCSTRWTGRAAPTG